MKREITRSSLSVTLRLVSDIVEESEYASSNYGGGRARSTTLQRTQDQQLSELLNILESKIETLQSRYLEVFATSRAGMEEVLVPLCDFTIDTDTTDENWS